MIARVEERRAEKCWPLAGGVVGEQIRARDWAAHPLGPLESWPDELRSAVTLVLASPMPLGLVWGPRRTQIYNDAYGALLGVAHPRALGRPIDDGWPEAVGRLAERAFETGTAGENDQRLFLDRRGEPEEAFFTHGFSPIRDSEGGVAGLLHAVVETTPGVLAARRSRLLRDLRDRTDTARSLADCLRAVASVLDGSAPDVPCLALYTFDDEQRTARLVARTGFAGEAPGALEGDVTSFPWPLAQAVSVGRLVTIEDVQARLPGLAIAAYPEPLRCAHVLPVHDGDGRVRALVVAGASPRLPVDDAYEGFFRLLAVTLADIVVRATAVETAQRRLAAVAELERAKEAFFANVSHEFRTPLNLMLGPLEDELAEREGRLPPGRYARLQVVHRNGLRLLRMVNTLLDFSHIEAGQLQASFEPVNLVALTEDLAGSFRDPIERAGLRLSTRLEALPEPVYVDREMWTKIVLNLLSNALKHTFKGGITVSLFASDESKEHVELRVDDTGVGIPEKERGRLFQRFHKIKGVRSRSNDGTGVGLALVRALATFHGGEVEVASREGLGSSFRVRLRRGMGHLPSARVLHGARATAQDEAQVGTYVEEALRWTHDSAGASEGLKLDLLGSAGGEEPVTAHRPRVFVADNNNDMRHYVARLLARSYDVRAFVDGEAVLEAAQAGPPDAIVLDMMLPPDDGLALLKGLRAVEKTCLIPVILLSARAGEESALEGIDAGADDYLVKPFSGKALLARVRSLLAMAKLRKESADRLAEANKELEAFSYSVSHDLRAPLRAIDGFSKGLLQDHSENLDEQGRRYLERVRSATQRMGQLIDDLLSLSRITRAPMSRGRIDVTALSRRVLTDLGDRDPERKVDAVVSEGLIGDGDSRLVMALLENLLGNAWKFTSKRVDARVEVGAERREGETIYFVRDNGAGFNMEYAGKLFAPFQRLHSPTEFQGTGIGLSTVQRIVTRHGGRIWAEAKVDQGATFFFTLGARS